MELEVATFQWAVELFAKALLQVLTSFLIGVRQPALLALELVSVKSVEHEPVEAFRGLEVAFAVGAVAVVFKPPLNAFSAEQRVASVLAALLWLLNGLQAYETLEVVVEFVEARFGGN